MTYRAVEIALRLVNIFGLLNGLEILFKLNSCKKGSLQKLIRVPLRKFDVDVFLRKGSSDWLVFIEVFVDEVYRIDSDNIDTILDIGANTGLTSVYYSIHFPKARIVSVEPENSNFEILKKNVSFSPNITTVNKALSDSEGVIEIYDPGHGSWGFQSIKINDAQKGIQTIESVSIYSLFMEYNISNVSILKIDIEGAEREVFSSDLKFLDATDFLFIELHPLVENSVQSFLAAISTKNPVSVKGRGENLLLQF